MVPHPKLRPEVDFGPLEDYSPPTTSGKAIASMVLGIGSLLTCVLTVLPAILLGILALVDTSNPRKHVSGKGLAITGILLGSFMSIVCLLAMLSDPYHENWAGARRARCTNNLKQIALAMQNYESDHGCYPPAAIYDANGEPLLSWRVLILPYLEQESLYRKFHLNEAWDSPHNKPLADQMPYFLTCPSKQLAKGWTTYEVVIDRHSMFT
jgi:hypothetical protein